MFKYYRRYPYRVSLRTRIFNVIRYLFMIPLLEKFLILQLERTQNSRWRKFIPPLYLYEYESYRTVIRNGIQFRLDISKLLDHESYFFSDASDLRIRNLYENLKPDFHVLDIGANIGLLSLPMSKICENGFVYCFEPDSVNFARLRQNVSLNGCKNIGLFNMALGDQQGSSVLYRVEQSNPGMNRILSEQPDKAMLHETVTVTTLDVLYEEGTLPRVDFMKIDTEGFELKVLKGGRHLIERFHPILFVELADINLKAQGTSSRELIDYLESAQYTIYDARDMSLLEKDMLRYTDIICFPH